MIPLVLLEDAEEHFGAPAQLACFSFPAWEMARHHQAGLRDATKLPFYQFGAAQCGVQIFFRVRTATTASPLGKRQFLKPAQGQQEPIVIDRDQRIAADPLPHPPGHNARKRIVRAPADERMEKIVRMVSIAIELDQ
jgi:hypothetical protein